MTKIIHTRPLKRYPGDVAVKLTRPATDSEGREWPEGTVFGCILASGIANSRPGCPQYVTVTLGASGRATFYGRATVYSMEG